MAQANKLRKSKSLFSTTLASSIGTGTGDTITLTSTTGLPTDTEVTITVDRVDSNGTSTPDEMERITGTISGQTLTSYTRGIDDTTEQSHDAGAVVEIIWNADDWNDHIDHHLVEHADDGTHSDVHADSIELGGAGATASSIKDEDDMDSDSYTALATQQSIKAYVDSSIQEATDGATVTFDLGDGANRKHKVTLGGNRTLALSNVQVGQVFMIDLIQDGTGSRTVTWFSTIKWASGSAPTLTTDANAIDTFGFICTSSGNYQGYVVGQNLS